MAVRPDGLEVWVSNHVSDSVSVIDTNAASPTFNQVIETIQDFDSAGATLFDEPVGIAFASNTKAYVALSSRNDVAVIDAATYAVTGRIHVTAQEPRAIAVRNGLLYVAAFESGNKSEIQGLGLLDLVDFATNPNLPGATKNIGVNANLPDRDLFVYNTATDQLVASVTGVGTLLYGVAVSSTGQAFVTETDALNTVNGADGSVLADLDNRLFDDQVATTTCTAGGCGAVTRFPLHALAPVHPAPGTELSTPYGIAISGNDQWLVGTSAGNSRAFLMTAAGVVRARLDLGSGADLGQQIPRGVALRSNGTGNPQTAYVLDTLENTVAVVNVTINPDPTPPTLTLAAKIGVGSDPTPAAVRRGAIAFNSSFASSSGTFSCGSCHPDGNTDQLLWRIGGACPAIGCAPGDEPRTTMPIRGLKDTLPLHWDGTLGDPFGGPNGAVGSGGSVPASCDAGGADGDHDCFRHLVNASLTGVMCDQTGGCDIGPSGLAGLLTEQEREDMAFFLASVSYPPARSRRMNDKLSGTGIYDPVPAVDPVTLTNPVTGLSAQVNALEGFKDFYTNQGGSVGDPDTCADSTAGCHTLPLGANTNSATLQGFDVPTMRGLTDRFVQFSIAPTTSQASLNTANAGLTIPAGLLGNPTPIVIQPLEDPIKWSIAEGMQEITSFGAAFVIFQPVYGSRPLNIFQSFEEASTQYPGATGRQVTLNTRTTGGGLLADTEAVLVALEEADADGMVNLRGVGLRDNGAGMTPTTLSFRSDATYKDQTDAVSLTHAQVVAEAQAGSLVMTFTAALRSGYGVDGQPLLSPPPTGGCTNCGDPAIPAISTTAADPPAFNVTAVKLTADASVVWDGAGVPGATLTCTSGGTFPACTGDQVAVNLPSPRPANGLHLVQVRNGDGPLSDELPVCVRASTSNANTAVCK